MNKRVGIFFLTKYGQTGKIANYLGTRLRERGLEVVFRDLADPGVTGAQVEHLDGVLVGAPIYREDYPRPLHRFLETNRRHLAAVSWSGFFSVCLAVSPGTPDAYLESLGPVRKLLDDAAWTPQWIASFAGALNYREYSPPLRFLMKRISSKSGGPTDTSRDHELTRWDKVSRFVEDFASGAEQSPFRAQSVPLATRTLNRLMPEYEHRLVQQFGMRATPDEVGAALKSLDRADVPLAELLARIRNFGRSSPAKEPSSFLQAAAVFGALPIAESQRHEFAGALVGQFWKRGFGIRRLQNLDGFLSFREAGYTKVLTNFWFDESRKGKTTVRTETRIHSLDPAAERRFNFYWFFAGLGIRLYMLSILRGIRKVASRTSLPGKTLPV